MKYWTIIHILSNKFWYINILLTALLGYKSIYRADLKVSEHNITNDLYDKVFVSIGNIPENDYQKDLLANKDLMSYDECIEALNTRMYSMLKAINKLPVQE